MTYKLKFIIPFFLAVILLSIVQCRTPIAQQEKSLADTTSAILTDTAASHSSKKIMEKKTIHIPLTVVIKNLRSPTAPVVVGVYKSKYTFLSKESRLKEYTFIPTENTLTAQITDINYDEIAVAVYQDMNSNGEFDKNFLGLPKEGYCFSNNFRPLVKTPCFNDCKFTYDAITNTATMSLIK